MHTVLQWMDSVTKDKFTVTYRKLDKNRHWVKNKDGRYFQKGFPDKLFDQIFIETKTQTEAKLQKMLIEQQHMMNGLSKIPVDVKK